MKLSTSALSLNKQDAHLHLHHFKMNLARTLNSDFFKKFTDFSQMNEKANELSKKHESRYRNRLASTPCIPVRVTNNYVNIHTEQQQRRHTNCNSLTQSSSENELDENLNSRCSRHVNFVQSKCVSPFLLRKTSVYDRSDEQSNETEQSFLVDDKISNLSSNISTIRLKGGNQSDSGMSSLNSAQLFIAEVREVLINKNLIKTSGSSSNISRVEINQSNSNVLLISSSNNLFSNRNNNNKHNQNKKKLISSKRTNHQQQHYSSDISSSSSSIAFIDDVSRMQAASLDSANLETLEYLLQLKKDENIQISQIVDQDGNSLLHKAIIYNQYDVVRYLLKNYPILVHVKNAFHMYPIHLCVLKGNMPIVRLVARESKKHINKRDASDMTPAMYAALEGKYETLKYLLDNANAKYNKVTKKERYTLLHLGVQSGSLDVCQYLLFKMGMSYLKSRTKDGATVFHLAAARGHDQILEYLLAIKASKYIKHLKDITGSTPAHDAAENGHYKCLKILYDAGLDMYEEDMENMTPYELAITSNSEECKNFVIDSLKPKPGEKAISLAEEHNINYGDLNNTQAHNSTTNNLNQTSGNNNKKINLRRLGSMLRLRRAKDISHEPAYLYRQKFRPAPVSLPEQSKITGFNAETNGHPEMEDELNDSAIDELINHVNNNGTSLKKTNTVENVPSSNRSSRIQQHRGELKQKDSITENDDKSGSPKRTETSNLGLKLKNSLSSSRESTPTIVKMSRSVTPTPLLQSVSHSNDYGDNVSKINLLTQRQLLQNNNSDNNSPIRRASKSSNSNSSFSNKSSIQNNEPLSNNHHSNRSSIANKVMQIKNSLENEFNKNKLNDNSDPPEERQSELNEVIECSLVRKLSLNRDQRQNPLAEVKLKRQSLNSNYLNKGKSMECVAPVVKSRSLNETKRVNNNLNSKCQIYEPEPDYWDVSSSEASAEKQKILKLTQQDSAAFSTVSLAQVIVQSVKRNEEIIVTETVQIVHEQEQTKNMQAENSNNNTNLAEYYSNNIYTNVYENENRNDEFEELPQPPTQSYLKLTNMENADSTSIPSPFGLAPPPPPPPPPLPLTPPPPPPLVPPKNALNLDSETLLLAKQKLKMKSTDSASSSEESPKMNTNKNSTKGLNVKKNDFLLQEIQNHRLYNTKKDYVLDYLDRNSSPSPVTYTSSNPANKELNFNRSLSSTNLSKENSTETVKIYNPAPVPPVSQQQPSLVSSSNNVSNYERFPYLRNHNRPSSNFNKYANLYASSSNLNKRAQSSAPNNRISAQSNQLESSNLMNGKSPSVDHLSPQLDFEEIKKDHSNNCVILIKNTKDVNVNMNRQAFNEIKPNRESSVLRSSTNNIQSEDLASRSDEIKELANSKLTKTKVILNPASIEPNYDANFSNPNPLIKKFRQIKQQESLESELDRVFKKRGMQNNN